MKGSVYVLILLLAVGVVGVCVNLETRIKDLEYEIKQQEIMRITDMEEMKRKQRLTSQDVQFLEDLVLERGGKE
jgi:uncharacterized membrane protein YqgA involved in biofilm formation